MSPGPTSPAVALFARPLRAVDAVECTATPAGYLVHARMAVSAESPYMAGHFPHLTIYPAVFIVESVRQAIAYAPTAPLGPCPRIVALKSVRLLAPLLAGDEARFELELAGPTEVDVTGPVDVVVRCWRRDGRLAATLKMVFSAEVADEPELR